MSGLHGNTPPAVETSSLLQDIRPACPNRDDIIPPARPDGPDLHAPGDGLAVDGGGPAGDGDRAERRRNSRVRHAAIGAELVVARTRVKLHV